MNSSPNSSPQSLSLLKQELSSLANPAKAVQLQRFFRTGKGQYAEGDVFLGIMVPVQREIAKKYLSLGLNELQHLLNSKIHEERLIALFILIAKYKISSKEEKKQIYEFYMKNTSNINNWDLVDLSAPKISGDFLLKEDRKILYSLAKSSNLWERRIAVLSCFAFIKERDFKDALNISEILLKDNHDLIHKAVGWMMREIGKHDVSALENFLQKYAKSMPRTMLRYSIEKFPESRRKYYLKK